jgi:hypothetical protein
VSRVFDTPEKGNDIDRVPNVDTRHEPEPEPEPEDGHKNDATPVFTPPESRLMTGVSSVGNAL